MKRIPGETGRRIRVCFLISSFAVEGPQGGAERFAIEIARRLDPDVFETTVCGLWDHGVEHERRWRDLLHDRGVTTATAAEWTGRRGPDAVTALRFARRFFQDHPQDVVNSHSGFADVAAVWGGLTAARMRLVRTLHSEREWHRHRLVGWGLNQLAFPWVFDAETAVSGKIASDLNQRALARLLGRSAKVVYNAIDWSRFGSRSIDVVAKRESLGLPVRAPVVGCVARFSRQKGHVHLVEAMALVVKELPDCQLLLVGGGELRGQIEAQVDDLGLGRQVHFVGTRTDIEEIYPAMDIFVSSSLWEGLSTVILEAMAASVPVVCTAVSGSSELVEDGRSGILVPPASPRALADAILELLSNRDKAGRLASQGHESAQRFSIEEVASEYSRLFVSQVRDCAGSGQ